MKTYCFIGSDKNAGKTTAFNFVYRRMCGEERAVCITSIGMNGEEIDQYEGGRKPLIRLAEGGCFITAGEHLKGHTGKYEMIASFKAPEFSRNYVLGRCTVPFEIVLEGPNTGGEILRIKRGTEPMLPEGSTLLIDGSIDRQFLANPAICDEFYFSVLFSRREPQLKKAGEFLYSLTLPGCEGGIRNVIEGEKGEGTKTLLLDEEGRVIYHGEDIPFCDQKLHDTCLREKGAKRTLYLNGALTRSLCNFLAPFRNLTIVLDNFTLYLNVSALPGKGIVFRPRVRVLNPVRVRQVFVKQEKDFDPALIPANVPTVNLFRKDYHEVGV